MIKRITASLIVFAILIHITKAEYPEGDLSGSNRTKLVLQDNNDPEEDISVGVVVGANVSNMANVEEDGTESKSKLGGTLGLYIQFPIINYIFIHPALLLTFRNFQKEYTIETDPEHTMFKAAPGDFTQDVTEDVSMTYIQIPIFAEYQIPIQGKIKPRVMLGPTFSFNVAAKNEASGFGDWDGKHDIDNLKTLDISAMVGAGVSFPIDKFTFGFDVIYDRSFGSSFKDVTEEELANDDDWALWTKSDPVTFERSTEAVDFKNTGISFQFSMVLPIEFNK